MANNISIINGKFVIGKRSVVGDPRRKYEDRVYVGVIGQSNEDPLIVGIVADGVGSADFGSRGAQLAIDTAVSVLEKYAGSDIPSLLVKACKFANQAVYVENNRAQFPTCICITCRYSITRKSKDLRQNDIFLLLTLYYLHCS